MAETGLVAGEDGRDQDIQSSKDLSTSRNHGEEEGE